MMMSTIAAAQSATATETSTQCEGAAAANKTSANSNESWNTPWTAVQLQATDEWLQQRLARKRASKGALVSGGGGGGDGGGGKRVGSAHAFPGVVSSGHERCFAGPELPQRPRMLRRLTSFFCAYTWV